jgi:hypothetical protein
LPRLISPSARHATQIRAHRTASYATGAPALAYSVATARRPSVARDDCRCRAGSRREPGVAAGGECFEMLRDLRSWLASVAAVAAGRANGGRLTAGGPIPRGRRHRDRLAVVVVATSSRRMRSENHQSWYCPLLLPSVPSVCGRRNVSLSLSTFRRPVSYTPQGMPYRIPPTLCNGGRQLCRTPKAKN